MKRIFSIGLSALVGAVAGGVLVKRVWLEKYRTQKADLSAAEQERELLYHWLLWEQRGMALADYFDAQGWNQVAVLGMNRIGRLAADALDYRVVYAVESENFSAVHERLTVYRLGEDTLPAADCMLVCDETSPETARREFTGEIVTLMDILEKSASRSLS